MDDYSNSAMIAFPAQWLYQPDLPNLHSTLFFFEEAPDKELLIEAIDALDMHNIHVLARVYEADWFGDESNVPVLKIKHNILKKVYVSLAVELKLRGLEWDTTFPYDPHVTVDERTVLLGPIPDAVVLRPPALWWKKERITI